MKKVIDGALYNTDTAKLIGSWDNGYLTNDFNFCAETLYRTKSGKYFIHGEGGARSQYSEWHGNSGSGGAQIRPYTPAEAREWAEEKLTADEYAAEFGEPEEASDGREVLNTTISSATRQKLEKLKAETGKPLGVLIDELLANA